ncbi:hypothetical protein SAMN04487818_105410 [Actinokineospora terrae]|uniref:Uncharacterized protein n=1 Tax=Actinokineospora terrae TaxID=155974 RepID=A0A1H9SF08_9PSEU|nr:hypothetical protein SAMN04487818_105410 [Actinokineospora terrae]
MESGEREKVPSFPRWLVGTRHGRRDVCAAAGFAAVLVVLSAVTRGFDVWVVVGGVVMVVLSPLMTYWWWRGDLLKEEAAESDSEGGEK